MPGDEPRNVDDVGYVEAADLSKVTPMREVLAQRRREHNAQDKSTREAAFRERAFLQVMCLHCQCCWPITKYETGSEHAEWCPSHHTWVSKEEVRKRSGR